MVISVIMSLELQFKDLTSNLTHGKDDITKNSFQCRIYTCHEYTEIRVRKYEFHRQKRCKSKLLLSSDHFTKWNISTTQFQLNSISLMFSLRLRAKLNDKCSDIHSVLDLNGIKQIWKDRLHLLEMIILKMECQKPKPHIWVQHRIF